MSEVLFRLAAAMLLAEDFLLRDRGRPQTIAVFREDSSRVGGARATAAGTFTNRPGDGESSQHAVVIVWDHLNTRFADAAQARKQVLQALGQIQSSDRIGLYLLDSQLRVIQDFTSDSALLMAALEKYRETMLTHSIDVPTVPPTEDPTARAMYEA